MNILIFSGYPEFAEAHNFAPQVGVFEIRDSGDASHGKVNTQVVLHQAIDWCGPALRPVTLGGNYNWYGIKYMNIKRAFLIEFY